jgi:hypothetical protein
MTILSELYDGDKIHYREDVQILRPQVRIPHPLNGTRYAEGVYMLGYAYDRKDAE